MNMSVRPEAMKAWREGLEVLHEAQLDEMQRGMDLRDAEMRRLEMCCAALEARCAEMEARWLAAMREADQHQLQGVRLRGRLRSTLTQMRQLRGEARQAARDQMLSPS